VIEVREFVGEDLESAVEKAAKHFGVGSNRLQVSVLSDRMNISGAIGKVVVLATVRDEPAQVGPVGEFLSGVLERMGISGARIDERDEEGLILLRVRSPRLRELLRRDPKVGGALSHLATRVAQRRVREEANARVEIEGGEESSSSSPSSSSSSSEPRLEELAERKAREARERGEEVVLGPMNSRERWVVHNALKSVSGVRSESVGEGRTKRVKIVPI
jgi:spoIIIJ-associated protein